MPRELAAWLPWDILPVLQPTRHRKFVSCWHLNEYESVGMWQLYSRLNEESQFVPRSRGSAPRLRLLVDPDGSSTAGTVFAGKVNYIDYDNGA